MGAFELNSSTFRNDTRSDARCEVHNAETLNSRRLREECIIAFKVYDSCRTQDCLTGDMLGPARYGDASFNPMYACPMGVRGGGSGGGGGNPGQPGSGDIITPPPNAASVTVDQLFVSKIIIVSKKPNPFKNGYWDIDLKYVFDYQLTFREADGDIIGSFPANSIYNKRVTLFGSVGSDLAFATDLIRTKDDETIDSDPFIMVEAKAVALSAEMTRCGISPMQLQRRPGGPGGPGGRPDRPGEPGGPGNEGFTEVLVTIGLFTIIKLYRIVTLSVESRGFCIPDECDEDVSSLNPCDFFNNLDFPMDIFSPPQRKEFLAGISSSVPKSDSGK